MKVVAIVLAAGYSSRMAGFKPLMPLRGRNLLARCAGLFRAAGIADIAVISGHRRQEVEAEAASLDLTCHHNPRYAEGMYSSVRAAMAYLLGIDGFFLLPVDIPLVRPATIAALLAAFDGRSVIYPSFAGRRGHPPLIPADLIPDIVAYDGGGGLKALLDTLPSRNVAVWDGGILLDADTPEDFAALGRRVDRLAIGDPAEALALAKLMMPARGVAHGLAVAGIAAALGRALNGHGARLDPDLLHNAALLHDVAKGEPRHEARGAELLEGLGLAGLAEIVAAHRDLPPPSSGRLGEKEVVHLADKLVRGTHRLSIRRRFAEKLELYAADQAACQAIRRRLAEALALAAQVERTVGKSIKEILETGPGR